MNMEMIKYYKRLTYFILIIVFIPLIGCEKDSPNTLVVNLETIHFEAEGGNANISLQTDAALWTIENPASDWIILSSTTGTKKKALITINVCSKTLIPRMDTLTISAGDAKDVHIIVSQASSDYL